MTIIGYSRGLKCFTKTVYTNPEGKEIIIGSDGKYGSDGQSIECDENIGDFCLTLSGSFNDPDGNPCQFSLQTENISLKLLFITNMLV